MCTYLIGSGPKIKEINGSPFANLFSEAAPRGGEANEGGAHRRALELSAAVRAGQSVRLGPRLLVHLPGPPGRIPLVPSVLQDRKVRRRGFGFALANTQPFATMFCGLFPSSFIPNALYWSPTGQAHSMENPFLLPSPGVFFHPMWLGPRKRPGVFPASRPQGPVEPPFRRLSVPRRLSFGSGDFFQDWHGHSLSPIKYARNTHNPSMASKGRRTPTSKGYLVSPPLGGSSELQHQCVCLLNPREKFVTRF